ncbi:MAG: hypothetical protein JF613_07195, partial [Acidobacteria bacterium]|nr:hypothetical protein [Acidobacteriota bacterium]
MRVPAACVAIPLFVGCAGGILLYDSAGPDLSLRAAAASAFALIAALGWFADGFSDRCAAAIILGCAISGVSLGLTAASVAYKPDLLSWFNACDLACHETPVRIEGVLREDAAVSAAGVSVIIEARAVIDPR